MNKNLSSIIIGLAVILTALILSNAFRNRNKASNTIAVTGLGSKDFISDLIVWNGSFMRKNTDLKEAYAALDKDRESIKNYMVTKGIRPENIIFSAVEINKEFDKIQEDLKELEKENKELKAPVDLPEDAEKEKQLLE